jgi:hypothetical protein
MLLQRGAQVHCRRFEFLFIALDEPLTKSTDSILESRLHGFISRNIPRLPRGTGGNLISLPPHDRVRTIDDETLAAQNSARKMPS